MRFDRGNHLSELRETRWGRIFNRKSKIAVVDNERHPIRRLCV